MIYMLDRPCPVCRFTEVMVKLDSNGFTFLCGHCFNQWNSNDKRAVETALAIDEIFRLTIKEGND